MLRGGEPIPSPEYSGYLPLSQSWEKGWGEGRGRLRPSQSQLARQDNTEQPSGKQTQAFFRNSFSFHGDSRLVVKCQLVHIATLLDL